MSLEVLKVKDIKTKVHKLDKKLKDPLPKHAFLMLLIAPPRSGKSALIANLIANPNFYNGVEYWDNIYYCSPTQDFDNTNKKYLKKMDNVIQISEHSDLVHLESILKDIIDKQKELDEKKEEKERILIILDDCVGYMDKNEALANLCTRYRHYGISIIITSQQYRKIPLIIRNCAGHIIFFKLNNSKELDKIDSEFGENYSDEFVKLAHHCTDKKYDFCYLNNEEMKVYHKFDTLVLDAS